MPDLGHGVGGDGDGDREVAMTASQGHGWSVGEWVNLGVEVCTADEMNGIHLANSSRFDSLL